MVSLKKLSKNMKRTLLIITVLAGSYSLCLPAYGQQTLFASSAEVTPQTAAVKSSELSDSVEDTEEQEQAPTLELSGSIDTYFRTAFGSTNDFYGGAPAPATAFADLKGFGLGMANLVANYSGEKAGVTVDLVFGPRGRAAVFNSTQGIINQMYAYYKVSDKVVLNFGQFNTFLGYEVISPAANFHYSTSYMFSYGPFSHTGLQADFDLGGGLVAKLAIMNASDFLEFNPVNTYTFGGQLGHSNDNGGVWLNVLYGDQDGTLKADDDPYLRDEDGNTIGFASSQGALFQVDLSTGWNLTEKFYLGLNTSWQSVAAGQSFLAEGDLQDSDGESSSFFGIALYPQFSLSESFSIGARAEYLGVNNGHLGIFALDQQGKGSVMEYTLSGNYSVGPLKIIPEFRLDMTSDDSFRNADGKATNKMSAFSVAAVYSF